MSANSTTASSTAVPPPGMLLCPRCQRTNPFTQRFCGGCGQSLWQKCLQCGAECAADVLFCGACGADLASLVEQQRENSRLRLDQAAEQAGQHHYQEAIETLRAVAAQNGAHLEVFAQRAQHEITRLEAEDAAGKTLTAEAVRRAQQFLDVHSYERAQQALAEVPPPLRSPAHCDLLARAQAARDELLVVGGQIRTALEEKKTGDLPLLLERLLALKPNHSQGQQLAEQLRDNLVKSAKVRLSQHRYQEALEKLQQVPSPVRTKEVDELQSQADELRSLEAELQTGALADASHVALANRLCSLAPGSSAAAKIRAQIVEKSKLRPADPRCGAPDWQPPPSPTLLGVPVDWLAQLSKARPARDEVARTLRQHPGQFFTACGLALQGLGLAPWNESLLPKDNAASVLAKLPSLVIGGRGSSAAWGLDLSSSALKAVKLVREGKNEVQIESAEYLVPGDDQADDGQDSNRAAAKEAMLAEFLSRVGDLKGAKVGIGMPGQRVLGRFFQLPSMPAKKAAASIPFEARQQLPIPLDELCWTSAIWEDSAAKTGDDPSWHVFVQAARELHVRNHLGAFKSAGISVDFIQSDCVALHNAASFEFFSDDSGEPVQHAVVLLDVGAECTNVVVTARRAVWFRTIAQGGSTFSQGLARELKLPPAQAQQALMHPGRDYPFSKWSSTLQPILENLGSEVERSLALYRKLNRVPLQRVYGCGGAFPTVGLIRHLRTGR